MSWPESVAAICVCLVILFGFFTDSIKINIGGKR